MKFFSARFTGHEMLRTKCFNIYLIVFGYYFQLGLYREYQSSLSGNYLGLKIALHFPFKPYRALGFIPSIYTITNCLNYLMELSRYAHPFYKKLNWVYGRYEYLKKN